MTRPSARCLLPLAMLLTSPAVGQAPPAADGLEIRFCPGPVARPYPLDSLRGVQSLLLHNIAIINRGSAPAELQSLRIELLRGGDVQDVRIVSAASLGGLLRAGQAVEAQGLMQLLAFQFCDGRLLGGATISGEVVLAPNAALLWMQNVFAWRGSRDEVRVTASVLRGGSEEQATASLRIDPAPSRTEFRWPLRRGPWLVGSGASFHTTHRWAIPEEFALDLLAVGADGRSYRGEGTGNADFLAYGAEVVAAADGTVARVITGSTERPPLLRRTGEAMNDYMGRISEQQAANIALGEAGLMGDTVIIDHGNNESSVYAHLVPGSANVRAGQAVRSGEAIGRLGSSGNSTEPHLHFQVCDAPSGVSCAGIVPNFTGIDLPASDGPRPLQSGDLVIAAEPAT